MLYLCIYFFELTTGTELKRTGTGTETFKILRTEFSNNITRLNPLAFYLLLLLLFIYK